MDNGTNGRDPMNGRFAPGWRGGPGNPHNKRVHENRKAFLDCVEPQHIKHFFAKLSKMADGGDFHALKLWLSYAIGPPAQLIEITTPEGRGVDLAMVAAVVMEAIGDDPAARSRAVVAFARLGGSGDGV